MASLTHKYIPRIQQTEENLFVEEYYSSTDTKIYIDDIEQTEISYINYALNEQLKPLYGYASNTFDDIAIGSRIVTGIFKTPISNPNRQSTKEDIEARAINVTYGDTPPSIGDYNDSESESTGKTDWIGNTDRTPGSTDSFPDYEDDTTYEYRNKLELLGFLPEGSLHSIDSITAAIKEFQKEHGLLEDGKLNSDTMTTIDNVLLNRENDKRFIVPEGTMIYASPGYGAPIYDEGIPYETSALVLGVFEGDSGEPEWLYVTMSDNTEGFINAKDNPEFKQYLDAAKG